MGHFSDAAGAISEVLDSDDAPLGELYVYPPSSPEPDSSSDNGTAVNSAGMQSMTSNVTEGHTDAVCNKNAFLLPLQLGQNDFNVAVTAPDLPEQVVATAPLVLSLLSVAAYCQMDA